MNPSIFSIRSQIGGEMSFTQTIPDILTGFLFPGTRPALAFCQSGYILIQEITSLDFSLWHHTILLTQDDSFMITGEQSVLSLNFCLQNSFSLYQQGSLEQLVFHEGQYNMSFLPEVNLIAGFQKDKTYSFLTLFYSPEQLSKITIAYPFLSTFLSKVDQKERTFLHPSNHFTTKEMKKILFRLLHDECKEAETNISIKKGKVLELLVKAIEQPSQPSACTLAGLNRQDVEKIYSARKWLDQQFNRPVTLFEMARKVGMNVHKLSSGFLQITGTTIFHYHRKVRMNKALQLLEETDLNLFDIGTEVGYMDGKTFSKEFKKEKGVAPFEYRKLRKLQLK